MHNGQLLLTSTDGFIFQSTCTYGCGTEYFIYNIKIIIIFQSMCTVYIYRCGIEYFIYNIKIIII